MGVPFGSIKTPFPATTGQAIAWLLRLLVAGHPSGADQPASAAEGGKSRLPLVRYTGCKEEEDEEDGDKGVACSICLCSMRRGHLIRKLSCCRHVFHAGCLDRWMAECSQANCPNCRALL